jgi:hypothetical protein
MKKEFSEALVDLIDGYLEFGSATKQEILVSLELKADSLRTELSNQKETQS